MLRKVICILAVCFSLMVGSVFADDINLPDLLSKLNLKQGIAYDVAECEINYLTTIPLVTYKGFSLEAGYSTLQKAVAVVSYEVLKLKDVIDVPILDLITFNVGYYVGFDRVSLGLGNSKDGNEFSHGPCISLINVKF